LHAFAWPVHRIGKNWQPSTPETTCLACYRTAELDIAFMELTPLGAALLELLLAEPEAGLAGATQKLADATGTDAAALETSMAPFIDDLHQRGVLGNTHRKGGMEHSPAIDTSENP